MSENTAHTGKLDAEEASRIMRDPNATEEERQVAASVLRQAESRPGETSPRVAEEASHVMREGATEEERSVAASDVRQADKDRDLNG